ncbi:hypothetical protein [Paenibacillus campi]|uniref:hypothetical protein n=1 Tax=Paenibacillus campi TaxID=3106031 RepID=UPI002AFF581D|nr:hypothetical protein [Paenibacillus sp. SGZ-1014]
MRLKLFLIHIEILVVLLLCGCMNAQPKSAPTDSIQQVKHTTEIATSDEQTASSEEAGFLTGDKFKQNSDFVIKAFELTYDKRNKAIAYHIEYQLGAAATEFIQSGQHPHYFRLEAPAKWKSSFANAQSAGTPGAKLNGEVGQVYVVDMRIPLQAHVTAQMIQKIVNDPYNYVLYVYENPEFPARTVGNVYGWMKNG